MFFNSLLLSGLAVILEAPLSIAIHLGPRALPNTLEVRQTCSSLDEATCEQSCMPFDAVCCNDGSSTYCPFLQTCVPDGCCPDGEICSGGGGTTTIDNSAPLPTATSDPFADLTSLLNVPTGLTTTGFGSFPPSSAVTTPTPTATSGLTGGITSLPSYLSCMPTLPLSIENIILSAAPSNFAQNPCSTDWAKTLPASVQSVLSSFDAAAQSCYSANSADFPTTNVAICTNGANVAAKNTATGGSTSKGAAPRPTGALGASLAGAVGVLGVMVAL